MSLLTLESGGTENAGLDPGSAFLLFARHCRSRWLENCEMRGVLGPAVRTPIFHLKPANHERLRTYIGETTSRWSLARGAAFAPHMRFAHHLCEHLRYCSICLQQGWHSACFQHIAVRRCPVHGLTLVDHCPRCHSPVNASCSSALENHLHCGQCAQRLGIIEAFPAFGLEPFERLRMALAVSGSEGETRSLPHYSFVKEAWSCQSNLRANQFALHCDGSSQLTSGMRHFKAQVHCARSAPSGPKPQSIAFDAVRQTLDELADCVRAAGALDETVWGLNAKLAMGKMFQVKLSWPTTALWNTSIVFGMRADGGAFEPVARKQDMRTGTRWLNPYEEIFPLQPEAIAPYARALVLNFFVARLVRIRAGYVEPFDVGWNTRLEPLEFAPAWKVCVRSGTVHAEVRSRADMRIVQRLVRRYASHYLRQGRKFNGKRWKDLSMGKDLPETPEDASGIYN